MVQRHSPIARSAVRVRDSVERTQALPFDGGHAPPFFVVRPLKRLGNGSASQGGRLADNAETARLAAQRHRACWVGVPYWLGDAVRLWGRSGAHSAG